MDKRYAFLGVILLVASIALMFFEQQQQRERLEEFQRQQAAAAASGNATTSPEAAGNATAPAEAPAPLLGEAPAAPSAPAEGDEDALLKPVADTAGIDNAALNPAPEPIAEELTVLENEYLRISFTNRGGAIHTVALKQYPEERGSDEPYLFNAYHDVPALSIGTPGRDGRLQGAESAYELIAQDSSSVTFRRVDGGLTIERVYRLGEGTEGPDPYMLSHATRFINQSDGAIGGTVYINAGTAPPTLGDPWGTFLNVGYYNGDKFRHISAGKFKATNILGIYQRSAETLVEETSRADWLSVKNQFFSSILTPDRPGTSVLATPVFFPPEDGNGSPQVGITGSLAIELPFIGPGQSDQVEMTYYVGPKEYPRLSKLEQRQDLVMQFGWFGFFSKLMLHVLLFIEGMVQNFGVAIILMTLLIRGIFWPLTAKAAESSKKMRKLQEPIKELRERYKDTPQKLNEEMLKLWRKHKVNPLAGCLPMLVQIPIFIAFFYMLRSASELRFAGFLWIPDLSLPDTVFHIGGFPVNIMPVLYFVSMYYQMKLQPMPSADEVQRAMFKFMPFIFSIMLYNFSSGLLLYWTVSNCVSMLQQYLINRKPDEEENPSVEVIPPGGQGGPAKKKANRPGGLAKAAKRRK